VERPFPTACHVFDSHGSLHGAVRTSRRFWLWIANAGSAGLELSSKRIESSDQLRITPIQLMEIDVQVLIDREETGCGPAYRSA
jgi:hypothetical protein